MYKRISSDLGKALEAALYSYESHEVECLECNENQGAFCIGGYLLFSELEQLEMLAEGVDLGLLSKSKVVYVAEEHSDPRDIWLES